MNLAFFLLIIAFINLILGFLVLLKDLSKRLNQLFFIFSLFTSIWILMNFMTGIQPTLFWLKSAYAFGATVPAIAILWIFLLCKEKLTKLKFFIFSVLGVLFFIISYLDGFIVGTVKRIYLGGYEGKLGVFFPLYSLYVIGILIFIIYKLFTSYLKAKGEIKNQLGYVLIGATLWEIIVILVSFVLPLFGIMKFIPFDSPSTLIFLIFTTFAILKYHLFGIKVLITELLIGTMGLILLILPFLMPTTNLKALTGFAFLLFLAFSYLLLKATYEEENRRRQAEELARQREELAEQFQVIAIRSQAIAKRAQEIAERERKLRKEMEQLMSAKEQFLLSVQHYFRTPLTSIIGYLEMINEGDYGLEKIPLVLKSALNLRKRIEESLDISAFQSGRAILQKEKVKVKDLIKQAIFETEIEAKKKNLYLKKEFPKENLPEIELDPKRMKEVFVNLIENGIKHTLKGGVRVGFKISIPPRHPKLKDFKESFLFWVKDTGIGMTKKEIESVGTSLFERGKRAKEISPMGKGLGLYLSRLIVQAHGGVLWAESEGKDKGTTFYVEIPIR